MTCVGCLRFRFCSLSVDYRYRFLVSKWLCSQTNLCVLCVATATSIGTVQLEFSLQRSAHVFLILVTYGIAMNSCVPFVSGLWIGFIPSIVLFLSEKKQNQK